MAKNTNHKYSFKLKKLHQDSLLFHYATGNKIVTIYKKNTFQLFSNFIYGIAISHPVDLFQDGVFYVAKSILFTVKTFNSKLATVS